MIHSERLRRTAANMKQASLSCILVSAPESVYYLTGRMIQPGERMLALTVYDDGRAELFVNRLFAQQAEEGLPLYEYGDTDDPIALLADYLPAGKVGIDRRWPSEFTIRLMTARPDILPVLGSAPVDDARMLKDAEEANLMRVSSSMNDQALNRLISTLREGDTEEAVGQRFVEIGRSLGALSASFEPLVCFGANCAEPHHASDATPLKAGDTIILDLGLNVNNAMSDMTRTLVLGHASQEQKEVYEIVRQANEAGRKAVAPGVPLAEIDRAAREVIEKAGYGPFFIHRTGHGIGLQVHEPPDVSASETRVAQKGMIFSIEPGIYLPGKFGVRIEDLVMVTENGSECLNALGRDLMEL